jgi:endoglucanase
MYGHKDMGHLLVWVILGSLFDFASNLAPEISSMRRLTLTLFFIASFASICLAQTNSLAWKRFQHLQHGVAVSGWFSESGHYSIQELRAFTTPADLEHIKKLGFDHIRIPIDPLIFECTGDWNSCERLQFLDQVVLQALKLDLAVIIDFHANPQYTHQLIANGLAAEKYLRLWAQIADHYGAMDQDRVVLEVMNEISVSDRFSWFGILDDSIRVIRHHAPNSTLIVTGAGYSDIPDLVRLPELQDTNLIYNFHYYEPHIFTHQGATWGLDYWLDMHNVPFPPTDKKIADAMERTDSEEAKWRLLQYKEDHWDADRIASDVAFAAQWAKERNVPLMCDEFGVYRPFVGPEDRERWLTAIRTAFEKNHIGWTAWDYQGVFGVVYKEKGQLRDDDVALRGLGMKK